MDKVSILLAAISFSLLLVGCQESKHRPIDVYLTVESERGSPTPPVGENYLNWGMTITASVDSPVAGETGTRYVCIGWTGTGSVPPGGAATSVTFTITENSSITWLWKTQYELTLQILPEGSGTVELSPAGEDGYYDDGVVVRLTANPKSAYVFASWSGDLSGTNNPETLTMDGPKSVTANFALKPAADFTASPRSGDLPLTVQFTDMSTGEITSWEWDFDNDQTVDSTEQNPTYTYTEPARYTVRLVVTGPYGSDEQVKTNYINVRYESNTIYVDGTTGDDTREGISWAQAVKTIQRGIELARDTWTVLVNDGTYTGDGNKNLDFAGKAIHLKSVGGAENCIIDCENSGRGFYFHSGETANSIVDGFTVRNGNADQGGGIRCYNSSPTIANCIIANNRGFSSGGGIWSANSSPVITNCAIINNNVTNGSAGGVYSAGGTPIITNCTITNNSARDGAGGIRCSWMYVPCAATISNCTVSSNTPGGIYCYESSPTFNNTILWSNADYQIYTSYGSNVTLNYCDYADNTINPNNIVGSGTVTANNCITNDPLFVDTANGDYHLQAISPCIDAGDNSLVPAGVTTDLDGNPRIQNGIVDIGAYEYQP